MEKTVTENMLLSIKLDDIITIGNVLHKFLIYRFSEIILYNWLLLHSKNNLK